MPLQQSYTLCLLGGFRLSSPSNAIVVRPSTRRLVALLAVVGALSRGAAAARLWPDVGSPRDASNLRTVLWRLRQDAPGLIHRQGDELRLGEIACDLREIRDWARRTLVGEQPWPLPEHASAELLPSWDEEWLIEPREELRILQLQALELAAQRFLMSGRLPEACSSALAAVRMDPLRESATRLLIEIHLREGNTLDALRRFNRFRDLLEREVGVGPSPAVRALVASLTGQARAGSSLRRLAPRT
jgi:DNA-binding SARP family transcriptional activator